MARELFLPRRVVYELRHRDNSEYSRKKQQPTLGAMTEVSRSKPLRSLGPDFLPVVSVSMAGVTAACLFTKTQKLNLSNKNNILIPLCCRDAVASRTGDHTIRQPKFTATRSRRHLDTTPKTIITQIVLD